MKISNPEILRKNGEIVYRVGVETSAGTDSLWYSVQNNSAVSSRIHVTHRSLHF